MTRRMQLRSATCPARIVFLSVHEGTDFSAIPSPDLQLLLDDRLPGNRLPGSNL
jgi:hypothetical protein